MSSLITQDVHDSSLDSCPSGTSRLPSELARAISQLGHQRVQCSSLTASTTNRLDVNSTLTETEDSGHLINSTLTDPEETIVQLINSTLTKSDETIGHLINSTLTEPEETFGYFINSTLTKSEDSGHLINSTVTEKVDTSALINSTLTEREGIGHFINSTLTEKEDKVHVINSTLTEPDVIGHVKNSTRTGLNNDVRNAALATGAIGDDASNTESVSADNGRYLRLQSGDIIDCLMRDAELSFSGYMSGVIFLTSNGTDPTGGKTFLYCYVTLSAPDDMFFVIRFFETEAVDGFFKQSAFQKQFGVGIRDEQGTLVCEECLKSLPMVGYSRTGRVRVEIAVLHFDHPFSFGFNFTAVSTPVVPKLEVVFTSDTEGQCQCLCPLA